jgi:NAD(P)-dependent dehydrogenase (short-subunit alcohol dehydrogenase family)
MELGLEDRVVLVTGASSGIGRAAARAFAGERARVAITYHRNRAGAEGTAERVHAAGGDALVVELDLADAASVHHAVASVAARWGGIDVLVNNAFDVDLADGGWQPMLRTNLEGVLHTLDAALPAMGAGGWGRVLFVSSSLAEVGYGPAPLAAAKAALDGLCRTLARELGQRGILVNVVMPGITTTESALRRIPEQVRAQVTAMTPSQRLSSPEDVANALLFLGSPANGNITGQTLRVTGG